MTDHNNTNSGQQSQILLADKFANPEADEYREGLEIRKADLEKDIAILKKSGIVDYKLLEMNRKSLKRVEEKLKRAKERDEGFKRALIFETVEEAMEKMTEKEGHAYFEYLTKLRDRRVTEDPSSNETFMGFVKKLFF